MSVKRDRPPLIWIVCFVVGIMGVIGSSVMEEPLGIAVAMFVTMVGAGGVLRWAKTDWIPKVEAEFDGRDLTRTPTAYATYAFIAIGTCVLTWLIFRPF